MYDNGQGIEQSNEKAAEWYRKAADQGDPDAKKKLSELGAN
jgi:TPR repeat protein